MNPQNQSNTSVHTGDIVNMCSCVHTQQGSRENILRATARWTAPAGLYYLKTTKFFTAKIFTVSPLILHNIFILHYANSTYFLHNDYN